MDELDKSRYKFYIKQFSGFTSREWDDFFNHYDEIPRRREILADNKKGYIYDEFNFQKLSLNEAIKLLIEFEFSECQKIEDWESFIDTYKDLDYHKILKDALANLKAILLDSNRLIYLTKYLNTFPEGIFIYEAKLKASYLKKDLQKAELPDSNGELSEEEKKEIVESISHERSKILEDYLGTNSTNASDSDIVSLLKAMKKGFVSQDIEQILEDAVKTLDELEIARSFTDSLISISADYRVFRFRQTKGILSQDEENLQYSTLIDRILKLFNLIMDAHKP